MSSRQFGNTALRLLGASILMLGTSALADVGAPVEIKMSIDTKAAVSGQEYAGTFVVTVFEPGRLADVELSGEGWAIQSVNLPAVPAPAQPGVIEIPFRAVPADANSPIGLSFTWNGHRVQHAFEIGPAYFARAGQTRESVRVHDTTFLDLDATARAPGDTSMTSSDTRGTRSPLRVVGRIVYTRPCRDLTWPRDGDCNDPEDLVERVVGADNIDVQIWDSDTVGHETIWSGYTDENGYFDTGTVDWDDGDDDPDLVLYYETDTVLVDVTDASIYEDTYEFESDEVENFTGSYYDFGWHTPADTGVHGALHIFSSCVRTRRFITANSSHSVPKVQVEWPHGDTGAWYEYWTTEIHISHEHTWRESTHAHEYGHHIVHSHNSPQPVDYCNDFCDGDAPCTSGTDCENPGHCAWCPENNYDAWNEAWPNWLADAVTRYYPLMYEFDDGSEFIAWDTESYESLGNCCQDSVHYASLAFITEGFIAAMLRDIEDGTQDDHDSDDIRDMLCTDPGRLIDIELISKPYTSDEFISIYRSLYPDEEDELWATAFNVAPSLVSAYPPDSAAPGAVPWADSPSHPLGGYGMMPCIEVRWQPADDDVQGANAYSYVWSTNPAGVMPDADPNDVDFTGCLPYAVSPPLYLGEYYFSIRARDSVGNWSSTFATFGPFVIEECNNNGILDICEIACDQSTLPLACTLDPNFCNIPGCGTLPDCNGNLVPDACDIASGTSEDCNLNAVPDECENMFHWDATSGSWNVGSNWLEGTSPTTNSEVCIDVTGTPTVQYPLGTLQIASLSCSENFTIAATGTPCDLTITEPSFVLGELHLRENNSVLRIDDRLDIGGEFEWTGSNVSNSAQLTGAGVTYANGGALISSTVHLNGHHLILDGNSTSVCTTGRVIFAGAATFEIKPGATYEYQGNGDIFSGWFDDEFTNGGTFIKSVAPNQSAIYMHTTNSGLIHVQAGTLKSYLGCTCTGDYLAEPGTVLDFNGGNYDFLATSSITAETLVFSGGAAGANNIRGTINVSDSLQQTGSHSMTIHPEATIVSLGNHLLMNGGWFNIEPVTGSPLVWDDVTLTGGMLNFVGNDDVETQTLTLGPGTIYGPSLTTVSGLLTLNGGGGMYEPGVINANGGVLIPASSNQRTIADRTLNNAATMTFQGPLSFSGDAVLNNLPGATIDIQADSGAAVISGGVLNNAGTLVKTAGTGSSRLQADITNTGTVEIQIGEISFYTYYGYFYLQTAGQTILSGGNIEMSGPAPLQISGGLLTGAGLITGNVLFTAGTTAPGYPIGQLDVDGTYTQYAGTVLDIELTGTLPGTYDALVCTGNVSLAGDMDVTFVSPYEPMHGDTFVVVSSGGTLSGSFDNVTVANLPPTTILDVSYAGNAVTLTVVGGDCDSDGALDVDDFLTMESCLHGADNGLDPGCDCVDLDYDVDVDLHDFFELQTHFTG